MLKDELDQKVRNYRINQSPPEMREKEIAEEVKKDSIYVWEALKKVFIRSCKTDEPIIISIGLCDDGGLVREKNAVYFKTNSMSHYRKLVFRRLKYPKTTMQSVCEIAKNNGITWKYVTYEARDKNSLTALVGSWYTFTYLPPQK